MDERTGADLERLWAGEFGDAYTERNADVARGRGDFWHRLLHGRDVGSALEVGCNVGANLRWIAEWVDPARVFGVDVNETALAQLRMAQPRVNSVAASARSLPFRDRWFDLVFTTGVLIHMAPGTLASVMGEVVRCSNRFVLCAEYFSERPTTVPYRGQTQALFKRDFGALYRELFPELQEVDGGFLGRDKGWDDLTWWLFERPRAPRSTV
jgi:pseudaminic acid biosynthesis-associated methylase